MAGVNTTEFVRKECIEQLSKLMHGSNVTLANSTVQLNDGRDLWMGSISFELANKCLWRLSLRFTTREARLMTAHATGINPKILTIPVIHSCIGETLNTIAGPIKHAALLKIGEHESKTFRPMLPKIFPTYDLNETHNVVGLAVDRFSANFLGGRVDFECMWSESFPNELIDDRVEEFGEMEFL